MRAGGVTDLVAAGATSAKGDGRSSAVCEPRSDLAALATGFARSLRGAGLRAPIRRDPRLRRGPRPWSAIDRPQVVYWAGRASFGTGPEDVAVYDGTFSSYFGRRLAELDRAARLTDGAAHSDGAGGRGRRRGRRGRRRSGRTATAGWWWPAAPPRCSGPRTSPPARRWNSAEAARLVGELRRNSRTRRGRRPVPTVPPRYRAARHPSDGAGGDGLRRRSGPDLPAHPGAAAPTYGPPPRRVGVDGTLRRGPCSGSPTPPCSPGGPSRYSLWGPGAPGSPGLSRGVTPTPRWLGLRHRRPTWSGGTRLGHVSGPSTRAGASPVWPVAPPWWSSPTAGTAATRPWSRIEMARLARVAHRVVWVNPLKASAGYEPLARGMAAALPYVDEFVCRPLGVDALPGPCREWIDR